MLQIGTTSGDQYLVDCRDFDVSELKPLLEREDITFVGHNIKFDYNMLKQYGIVLKNVYDTMVVDQVLHNGKYTMLEIIKNKRFSMQSVYRFYFKKNIEKDVREEFLYIGNKPFTERQWEYGGNDVIYPFHIKEEQEKLIVRYELDKAVRLENKFVLCLGDIEYNGFFVDKQKWEEVLDRYALQLEQTIIKLDEALISNKKGQKYKLQGRQLNIFYNDYSERLTSVNWKSSKVVLNILKDVFNITPIDKNGKESSSKNAIDLLDETKTDKIVYILKKYREEEKIINSFGQKYLDKYIDFDGRIRPTFNQVVATGRVSCRNPNLQQIPRGNEHRSCFVAEKGYLLSTSDYASQESRIMADFADDEAMINLFNEGDGDIHSFVATKIFSKAFNKKFVVTDSNENKEYRHTGKTLNFSISFGASAYSLAKRLRLSEQEAQELIDFFYDSFPNLRILFEKAKSFALENGYIITNELTNMRRWFPEWKEYKQLEIAKLKLSREQLSKLNSLKGKIERRAQNSIIQGSAGIMTKLASILLRQELLNRGIRPLKDADVKIVNLIHDEMVIEIKQEVAEKYSKLQKYCMEKAGDYICNKLTMLANPAISDHWHH